MRRLLLAYQPTIICEATSVTKTTHMSMDASGANEG